MFSADRRMTSHSAGGQGCAAALGARRVRSHGAVRGGFTLVEMMISVTLVLLMMLMFAEIYSLAQQTMSTQRGIAENDQKARILAEVLRRDLDFRTFRSVYPFRLEPDASFAASPPNQDQKSDLITRRQGYFSISENHPEVDTDDLLQLTVQVDNDKNGSGGRPGDRLFGKASEYTSIPPAPPEEGPEFDDGMLGNFAGASGTAEVSYFLRNGNLYRSQLLVRKPYFTPNTTSNATPPGFPSPYPAPFAQDFDYAAYRDLGASVYEPRFHGYLGSLNNNTDGITEDLYIAAGAEELRFPRVLSVPHLRFGHLAFDAANPVHAPPLEFLNPSRGGEFDSVVSAVPRADYFGRFTRFEQTHPDFLYPGSGASPFDNVTTLVDADQDGVIDAYGGTHPRRGVDLMLSSVHSFDIEVWDDIVGNFVSLGHTLTGENPYIRDTSGNPIVQDGFYHRSRLRRPIHQPDPAALALGENYYYDHPSLPLEADFGNRYDTWSPRMYVTNGPNIWRTGRAPYKPQMTNPDPNTAAYNDPMSTTPGREASMAFGNTSIDIDSDLDGLTLRGGDHKESDGEVPLRAIRITIRYLDLASGQTRQTTIEQSLID